jgi:cytochrome c biogenesis protein CcmG/thiol:disulfide interchange protein DsbE
MRLSHVIPILLFCILIAVFVFKFTDEPSAPASTMIAKPLPSFSLQTIEGKAITDADISGWTVINVFASWCQACLIEHPLWLKYGENIPIIGVAWRDNIPNTQAWLDKWGNPYQQIAMDPKSDFVIALGITGAPETLLISPQKKIIKHIKGPVNQEQVKAILELIK